jgi:hypothetical protein
MGVVIVLSCRLLVLAACSGAPSHPSQPAEDPRTCPGYLPLGTRSMLTIPVHAQTGPDIDEPVSCTREIGAFIRVHGHGTHPIGFPANAAHPCGQPDCIMVDELVGGVLRRLDKRRDVWVPGVGRSPVWVTGTGVGVCGDGSGDYGAMNASVQIGDWKDADYAVAMVDEELRDRDAGSYFGISVRGDGCQEHRTDE